MITTRREVDIERGNTTLSGQTYKRVVSDDRTITVNPQVDVRPYSAPAPTVREENTQRITPAVHSDEFMPTIRSKEHYEDAEERTESRALSSKAKAMVFVYMAASLILALIVLATGIAITGATKDVQALESEVRTQSAVLAEATNALSHYSDEITITGAATEMGMVKGGAASEVELIELTDTADYEARTNAFDKVCDFLSKIIGG